MGIQGRHESRAAGSIHRGRQGVWRYAERVHHVNDREQEGAGCEGRTGSTDGLDVGRHVQHGERGADPKAGISGIAPMGKGNEAGWNWTNFLFEAGGDIEVNEDGKVKAVFNSEAGVKALDFYKKLRWEANAIPQDWALGWGDAVSSFQQGRTAMVIAGAFDVIQPALNEGGMKPEDVLAYPMPAMEKGGAHHGILGGNYLVINPNATKEEQEMAFRYITFDYFTDDALKSVEDTIHARKAEGKYFVPTPLEYFSDDSEYAAKVKAIYDKYDNVYKYDPRSSACWKANRKRNSARRIIMRRCQTLYRSRSRRKARIPRNSWMKQPSWSRRISSIRSSRSKGAAVPDGIRENSAAQNKETPERRLFCCFISLELVAQAGRKVSPSKHGRLIRVRIPRLPQATFILSSFHNAPARKEPYWYNDWL